MSRRRYWYDPEQQKVVELKAPPPVPEGRIELMTGTFYDGARATDGTDIGSRQKHAEYMRIHGLAMASDYTKHLEKARAEREAFYTGRNEPTEPIREALAETINQLRRK